MSFTMLLCGENSGVGGERKKKIKLDKLTAKCCICKFKTLFHEPNSLVVSPVFFIFLPKENYLFTGPSSKVQLSF